MHFTPKQAEVLAAICRLQESGSDDITLERLGREIAESASGPGGKKAPKQLNPSHVSRIIAGIKDREKVLVKKIHNRKVSIFLNPNAIATTGLVARILLDLDQATRSDHVRTDEFRKSELEAKWFKASGKDESYMDRVLNWCLLEGVGYAYVAKESPDFIGATDRVSEERDYLDLIAVPK